MASTGILLREKQARMLMALRDQSQNWYISSLAKAAGTTYVSACNFLISCERLGIVSAEKHGKIKSIKLTEKGAQVAEHVSGIYGVTAAPSGNGGAKEAQSAPAAKKPDEKEKK